LNTSRAEANNVSHTSDEKWYDVPISNSNDNEMDNIVIEKRGDTGKGKTKREERKAITTMLVIVWFLSWFFVWFLVLLMRRITNSINLQLLCYLLAKTVPPGT
jgi:hypothetical protein